MTVDMLAAAFIWPEEMLIGRTHIGDDLDPDAQDDTDRDTASEPETQPFWAALVRRFRAERVSPDTRAR